MTASSDCSAPLAVKIWQREAGEPSFLSLSPNVPILNLIPTGSACVHLCSFVPDRYLCTAIECRVVSMWSNAQIDEDDSIRTMAFL